MIRSWWERQLLLIRYRRAERRMEVLWNDFMEIEFLVNEARWLAAELGVADAD